MRVNSKLKSFTVDLLDIGILDRFKKKEPVKITPATKEPSIFKKICGDDNQLAEELSYVIFLRTEGIGTYEQAMERAKDIEKVGRLERAIAEYRDVGCLALYEGNVAGVKRAFNKVAELSDRKFERIRDIPGIAVEKTKEYCDYLKQISK